MDSMPRLSDNRKPLNERPDITLLGGSPFGQCVNEIFRFPTVTDCCKSLFSGMMLIPDNLITEIDEADKELFLPDPFSTTPANRQNDLYVSLIGLIDEQVKLNAGQFDDDVYFDAVAYRKDAFGYLSKHPFIRKALMQQQADYLRTLFPYEVRINIESGYKSKGIPGFYLSQQRIKVGIYRTDWFYMSLGEIRDFIHATVHRFTGILPDTSFLRMVKSAGVGTIELIELRSLSSVYRFYETNLVCQVFTDGHSRCFESMEAYKSEQPLDHIKTRFKYSAAKLSFLLEKGTLIGRYLEPPYAEVQILLADGCFSLDFIDSPEHGDPATEERILAYITRKLRKYGKTLPFQKQMAYENR